MISVCCHQCKCLVTSELYPFVVSRLTINLSLVALTICAALLLNLDINIFIERPI